MPRSRLFWTVSLGHLAVDMFAASVPVLMAFLSGHLLPMTNTQLGFAVSAFQLTGAISQPFCGWLADRTGGRWLGAGGLAWMVSLIALSLVVVTATRSYTLMLIPLVLAALGSGAFHPVGTMHAAGNDHVRETGSLAVFFLVGSLGGALGPVMIGILLDGAATHNNLFTAMLGPTMSGRLLERGSITPILVFLLVALPAITLMALIIPSAHAHRSRQRAETAPTARRKIAYAPLLLLALVITLRGALNPGLVSFLPRLFEARGYTSAEYGLITSLYWIGGGVMGVIFGQLADRFGNRPLIVASMLLSAPVVFGLTLVNGVPAFVLALLVGAFSGGSHSLLVSMTQKMMPTGRGFASGAALGFIFGTGALVVLVIGALADRIGLDAAFRVVAALGVITGVLALLLPGERAPLAVARADEALPASEPV
jgi:FSR family fosmidomycin resistance protein-like MFS transporter